MERDELIKALKQQADVIEEAIAGQLVTTREHIASLRSMLETSAKLAEETTTALNNALAMLGTLREKIDGL